MEAFDGDKAFDLLQAGQQIGGDVEIALALAFGGDYFEDDDDHGRVTFLRKVRSSRSRNFSVCAKA